MFSRQTGRVNHRYFIQQLPQKCQHHAVFLVFYPSQILWKGIQNQSKETSCMPTLTPSAVGGLETKYLRGGGAESAPPYVTQATQKLYATCQKWHLIWLPILLISSPVKKSNTYQSGYFFVERLLATNNDVLTQNVVHTPPES